MLPRLKNGVVKVPDLPPELIERLRKVVAKQEQKASIPDLYRALGRMQNIDHRQGQNNIMSSPQDTRKWSGRVRQMKIRRTFPNVELVIKRSHDDNARNTIDKIMNTFKRHQQNYPNAEYVLVPPKAYDLGQELIAMPKTNVPSVREIIGELTEQTPRGQKFFKVLQENFGVTKKKLEKDAQALFLRIIYTWGNFTLLGVQNGKFVFMLLAEPYG
ncbi:hypothetical protein KKE06_04840 [Candidatus Micrarchaeota archaeon]|nr:hypothetical protein [Candidatus Micrarchaeota archaeon]MBU1931042.1 hypothetical protein [Candidatus Micrarchaeota archaeon]